MYIALLLFYAGIFSMYKKKKKWCSLSVLDVYLSSFILCEDLLNVYTALLSVHTAHLSVVCTERIGCISLFFYSMQGSFRCIKKKKKWCSLSVLDVYHSSFILCRDLLNVYKFFSVSRERAFQKMRALQYSKCMWMYIYIYIYTYVCMYMYMYIFIYTHCKERALQTAKCFLTRFYIHIYIYISVYTDIHTYMYTFAYIYICIYIHVYIHINLYVYMYIHIYTYIYTCI